MKRRLYPVVRHGARWALMAGCYLVYCFSVALFIYKGNIGSAEWFLAHYFNPAQPAILFSLLIMGISGLLISFNIDRIGSGRKSLRLTADRGVPKLTADASATLLTAADRADVIEAV